jgi:hypothetical protein
LINHHDRGRFVQQSYYGDADGSLWNKQPWRWNPVQGGDWKGTPAEVLESRIGKDELYMKTRPRHWASGAAIDDAVMEMRVRLGERHARIHYVFAYSGTHSHEKRDQELPAVFVDYGLKTLVFYRGDSPWTKGALTRVVPGWPNEGQRVDESWAAYVDEADWGLGVFTHGMRQITSYRYTGDGKTGATAGACSYFAPVDQMRIVPGFRFEYDVYLTIGKVDDMRGFFYEVRSEKSNEVTE